jgi:hypothetical protein
MPSQSRKPLRRPASNEVVTKDKPEDYTGPEAGERTFYLNFYFIRFGTKDKIQGAAITLSVLLLLVIATVIIIGAFNSTNASWLEKSLTWLGSTFVFLAGVAVGRAGVDGQDQK